jgi:GNAT superfamily N-acetyltransferase
MRPAREADGGSEDLTVVRAEARDVVVLSGVIAEAFAELAPSRWLIPRAERRREILPGYFRLVLEYALAGGVVYTTPGRTAAALWLPGGPGAVGPPEGYRGRVAAVTDSWASRFAVFDAALERRHPAGPHQYLAILAVRPDRQGRGTGTALLRARHDVLDREPGIVAYLEASSRRVRQLYLAHGYADHGVPIQLPSGPAMYPMIRQPRVRGGQDGGSGAR